MLLGIILFMVICVIVLQLAQIAMQCHGLGVRDELHEVKQHVEQRTCQWCTYYQRERDEARLARDLATVKAAKSERDLNDFWDRLAQRGNAETAERERQRKIEAL